jgi:hypothetical protein
MGSIDLTEDHNLMLPSLRPGANDRSRIDETSHININVEEDATMLGRNISDEINSDIRISNAISLVNTQLGLRNFIR